MPKNLAELFDDRFQGNRQFSDFLACQSDEHVRLTAASGTKSFTADDELRAYHLFLQSNVVEHLYTSKESVFSYRKNFGIVDAVKPHADSKYFYKTDLQSFFASIDDEMVLNTIKANRLRLPFVSSDELLKHVVQVLTFGGTLPPGFATSPGLSNACLYRFDQQFGDFCKARDLIYTRYSDDIIVSGSNLDTLRVGAYMVTEALRTLYGSKFFINSYKSKFFHKGKKVKLLGLIILPNGRITVDRRLKNLVESLIYFYTTNSLRFVQMVGGDVDKGEKKIAGYLNHFKSIDAAYIEKLRRKYGANTIDMFINLPKMNFS